MASIIQIRRDSAANWTSQNPILANGEQGYETDTFLSKFGDGVNTWTALTYFKGYADHDDIANNGGAGSHVTITSHIADGTLHFTEASISITESQISDLQSYLLNITAESVGDLSDVTNTTPADKHVLVYDGVTDNKYENRLLVEADISDLGTYLTAEVNDLSSSVTWVNVPDLNITETSVTQHQAALSVTESQISDLQSYLLNITAESVGDLSDVTNTTPADKHVLVYDGVTDNKYENRLLVEADISDLGSYLTTEVNDLSSAVTWVNVPDLNITQTSVTQHEGALTITESQISDLGSYITSAGVTYEQLDTNGDVGTGAGQLAIGNHAHTIDDLTDVTNTTPADKHVLVYDGVTDNKYENRLLVEADISDLGTYATKASTINTQNTGSPVTYTLVLTDADTKIIEMDSADANTLVVPLNASVAFPTGTKIDIVQYGAGVTTIEGEGSPPVTIRTAETLVLDGQYAGATLYKRATDEWVLIGRLVAL